MKPEKRTPIIDELYGDARLWVESPDYARDQFNLYVWDSNKLGLQFCLHRDALETLRDSLTELLAPDEQPQAAATDPEELPF